jgi:hypothetical protein
VARGERGIWQRRFWKHLLRDERDFSAHMDYVHFNPVKHGHVARVADWPYSTFHALVAEGIYPAGWAGSMGEQGGHILICEFPPLNAAQCASLIAPYREQALSTRLVTQIDIHRLHRLTQINAD